MNNLNEIENLTDLNEHELSKVEGGFLPLAAAAAIFIIGTETGWW
jgi:lactobin A/cerein 7B family class IIb bacteriocin